MADERADELYPQPPTFYASIATIWIYNQRKMRPELFASQTLTSETIIFGRNCVIVVGRKLIRTTKNSPTSDINHVYGNPDNNLKTFLVSLQNISNY